MSAVAHHILLVVALVAVGFAGVRVASAAGARGLELVVGGAVVAAALAGISALALGLVALGGSAVALAVAALGSGAVAAWRLPPPAALVLPRPTIAFGAAAGAAAVWVAWIVKEPALAIDPLSYHLPESVMWVQQGTPGSVELITYEFPQGNYPVTGELLVAWLMGIGRSFAPALLWVPATAALLAASMWLGLRRLGAAPAAAGLAIAAVLLIPVAASQQVGPHTDLPALAWLAACGALATRRETLPLALLAAALAVGTKTTVAPLALIALAAGFSAARASNVATSVTFGDRARPLALAALAGTAVGGVWYIRNLVDHGSPLWPFVATSWGDPVPPFLDAFDVSFLQRPTWRGEYVDLVGGGLVILAAGLLAPLASRKRIVVGAAGAAALALVAWLNAPFTGAADDPVYDLSLTTTRYLLPAIAAAAVAVALTRHRAAPALLSAATAISFVLWPEVLAPPQWLIVAGAGAGAGLAFVYRRRVSPRGLATASLLLVALAAVAALTVAGEGVGRRHGGIGNLASSGAVYRLSSEPRFTGGDDRVAFAPQSLGLLAGDHLEHPIEMIPAREPCARTLARRGWIVVADFPFPERREPFDALRCLAGERPFHADSVFRVYFRG